MKKNYGKHKRFLHVIMIQSCFKSLFATSVKYSDFKVSPFVHKMAKIYPFRGRGFHTPIEWKIGYCHKKPEIIIQILILNTAFYIYGNKRLKDISIFNLFEQIQENTVSGSAFSARLESSAVVFIPDRLGAHTTTVQLAVSFPRYVKHATLDFIYFCGYQLSLALAGNIYWYSDILKLKTSVTFFFYVFILHFCEKLSAKSYLFSRHSY